MNINSFCRVEVDLNKCEGHRVCMHVCPTDVIKMQRITSAQFSQLTIKGKLNAMLSNKLKANVVHPGHCTNCGFCVTACTEGAITLRPAK